MEQVEIAPQNLTKKFALRLLNHVCLVMKTGQIQQIPQRF